MQQTINYRDEIVYSIKQNTDDDASSFTIDSEDGELRFSPNPDYEQQSLYTGTVLATDTAVALRKIPHDIQIEFYENREGQ